MLLFACFFVFFCFFFFFNDTATTEIYTLSLHDALPISCDARRASEARNPLSARARRTWRRTESRSEEHTSELQSLTNLVCRLLLEKKKNKQRNNKTHTNRQTDNNIVHIRLARHKILIHS